MGTTEPIRDKEDLKNFLNYYKKDHPSPRNYAMTVLGLHTALRISDVLNLKWENVYNFQKNCFLEHICLCEKKTGKQTIIAVNTHVKEALERIQKCRSAAPRHTVLLKKQLKKRYYLIRISATTRFAKPLVITHGNRGFHLLC